VYTQSLAILLIKLATPEISSQIENFVLYLQHDLNKWKGFFRKVH
jgi:hypothetical protein